MRAILGGVVGRIPVPSPAMVVALLALLIACSGAAFAAGSFTASDGTITACRDNKSGVLRVIQSGQTCASKETTITWKDGITGKVADSDKLDNKDSTDFYSAGSTVSDSDKLDGQDANAFLGASQKAADSEKLDGQDSTAFAKSYKRTVVVSPTGTDTQNGQALLDALSGITGASASKQYLLYVEPGTYDLGHGSLSMKQHVDIQGAGELQTLITSDRADSLPCDDGTVEGVNDAELRFLTVRNTGTVLQCHVAIHNASASPRLTHVTAEATAVGIGTINYGVYNVGSSPIMTDVTAMGSEGESNYGVRNTSGSSPIMTDVAATASGGTQSIGVRNSDDSGSTITQSKLSGNSYALYQRSGGTLRIALTQLAGPIDTDPNAGDVQCFNNYDGRLDPVGCP